MLLNLVIILSLGLATMVFIPFRLSQFALQIIKIVVTTAFVYSLRLWLNFDACSPKFQYLVNLGIDYGVDGISLFFVLLTTFLLCFFYFGFFTLKSPLHPQSVLHLILVFLLVGGLFLELNEVFFYLVWSSIFINYYIKFFLDLKLEVVTKTVFYQTILDYYSTYLCQKELQTIYKTVLKASMFQCFFFKALAYAYSFFSFVSGHSSLVFLTLLLPSVMFPSLVINFILFWFLLGILLLFLADNPVFQNAFFIIFKGKVHLKFSSTNRYWLLNLSLWLLLEFILIVYFSLNITAIEKILGDFCAQVLGFFFFTTVQFSWFSFTVATFFLFFLVCYLLKYSYKYSSQTWVFFFNALHFLFYIMWVFLINYSVVADFFGIEKNTILLGTGLYFIVWVICLVFSVRLSTGSWEELTLYFSKETREKLKTQKSFTVRAGIKTIHQARVLQDKAQLVKASPAYNYSYIIIIVHLYACAGWFINHGALLSSVVILWGYMYNSPGLWLPPLALLQGFCSFFLFALHGLSRDSLWYFNFRKANGQDVLSNLGWNMLQAAALNLVKTVGTVGFLTGVYGAGVVHGTLLHDSLPDSTLQKETDSVKGKIINVEKKWHWDLSAGALNETKITIPNPLIKGNLEVVLKQEVLGTSITHLKEGLEGFLYKKQVPLAISSWIKTGKINVVVANSLIVRRNEGLSQKEEMVPGRAAVLALRESYVPSDFIGSKRHEIALNFKEYQEKVLIKTSLLSKEGLVSVPKEPDYLLIEGSYACSFYFWDEEPEYL